MTPLVIFVLAWAGGVLLAQAALFPAAWLLLALPAAFLLQTGWGHQRAARLTAFALIGLLIGAGRLLIAQPRIDAEHVAFYNDAGRVTLQGVVSREPDRRPTLTNLDLDVQALILADGATVPLHGRVLVKAPAYTAVEYGDLIRATGMLETPPVFEDFSYRDYLARQGVHSLLRQAGITVMRLAPRILSVGMALPFQSARTRHAAGDLARTGGLAARRHSPRRRKRHFHRSGRGLRRYRHQPHRRDFRLQPLNHRRCFRPSDQSATQRAWEDDPAARGAMVVHHPGRRVGGGAARRGDGYGDDPRAA